MTFQPGNISYRSRCSQSGHYSVYVFYYCPFGSVFVPCQNATFSLVIYLPDPQFLTNFPFKILLSFVDHILGTSWSSRLPPIALSTYAYHKSSWVLHSYLRLPILPFFSVLTPFSSQPTHLPCRSVFLSFPFHTIPITFSPSLLCRLLAYIPQ